MATTHAAGSECSKWSWCLCFGALLLSFCSLLDRYLCWTGLVCDLPASIGNHLVACVELRSSRLAYIGLLHPLLKYFAGFTTSYDTLSCIFLPVIMPTAVVLLCMQEVVASAGPGPSTQSIYVITIVYASAFDNLQVLPILRS